ncbi:hypothetical protein P3S68_014289 [Capsicum galapagoense]
MVELEVHFIVTACENMINDSGMSPGGIVTASNGKTSESSHDGIYLWVEHYLGLLGVPEKSMHILKIDVYIRKSSFEPRSAISETLSNYACRYGDIDLDDQ